MIVHIPLTGQVPVGVEQRDGRWVVVVNGIPLDPDSAVVIGHAVLGASSAARQLAREARPC